VSLATTGPAVVCRAPSTVVVSEVAAAALGPRDVLVRRHYSGVSNGTDKWVMSGRFGWSDLPPPLVPGYQAAGAVEAVGAEVQGLVIGQGVFVTHSRHLAEVSSAWGGHASIGVTPDSEVYDATGIPGTRAALTVTAQVGYNAASRLLLEPGDPVVVIGDGIIGASAALACLVRGFTVTVVGRHLERLGPLEARGVQTLAADDRTPATLGEIAPRGVIDTVQNDAAFDSYIESFAPGVGQLVFSGHSPDGVTTWGSMARLQQLQHTVHFVSGWTRQRVETVLELMRAGEMACDDLIGTVADTPQAAAELMTSVAQGRPRSVASVIDWSWT